MSGATFGFTMQVDEWPNSLEPAAADGNDPRKSKPYRRACMIPVYPDSDLCRTLARNPLCP